jgi:acetyl-CoA acetyltransferase
MMRQPLSLEEYQAARYIVEPLRLFDCSVQSGVGAALILTRADRAASLKQRPVYIRSYQGIHAGPNEAIFGQRGLGIGQAATFDYHPLGRDEPVYRRAGVAPEDVSTLACYDAFTPQVLWTLERFGFCEPGEAADWIQNGRIETTGSLPVNTSGGHLSEGHTNGWGATVEMVTQLRGQAGDRQLPNIHIAQWATTLGDSLIYGID